MKWTTYTIHVEYETGEILKPDDIYKKNLEVKQVETKYKQINVNTTEKTVIKLYGPRQQHRLW